MSMSARGDEAPEGYFVNDYSADMLRDCLKKNILKGALKDVAENLKEDANPVLVIAKLRQ